MGRKQKKCGGGGSGDGSGGKIIEMADIRKFPPVYQIHSFQFQLLLAIVLYLTVIVWGWRRVGLWSMWGQNKVNNVSVVVKGKQ